MSEETRAVFTEEEVVVEEGVEARVEEGVVEVAGYD